MLATRHWDRLGNGGLTFTELGFGTAPIGNLFKAVSDDEAHVVLEAAWSGGVRYFDTAPLYGLGLSETRLNRFLRDKPRDAYVLSSKIGRLLRAVPPDQRDGVGKWVDVPARREVFDYSYDGTMRSLEFSLERLGVERIDVLYAHDLDIFTHGSREAMLARLEEFVAGAYRALVALRDQGVIRAFGGGINEVDPCLWLLERCDIDIFLLAGRYTLLEQEAQERLMPLCVERGVGIVIGGPYNSGILATGPRPGAHWNYAPAPDWVIEKAGRLQAVCESFGVRLVDVAFQFPLKHRAVVSVIPGGQGLSEMTSNLQAAKAVIPQALWEALRAEGLLRADAPI